jgi:hypothetical protein
MFVLGFRLVPSVFEQSKSQANKPRPTSDWAVDRQQRQPTEATPNANRSGLNRSRKQLVTRQSARQRPKAGSGRLHARIGIDRLKLEDSSQPVSLLLFFSIDRDWRPYSIGLGRFENCFSTNLGLLIGFIRKRGFSFESEIENRHELQRVF